IPLIDLDQDDKRNRVALFKIHATKEEALKTIESWRKSTPGFAFYSFYRGRDGVIMPTTFSLRSAPLFHALWPKLKEDRAQQAAEYARGWGQIANSINPIPCTHVDDNGELRWAINFSNC